jgi:glycosyltransferase 2 family protein
MTRKFFRYFVYISVIVFLYSLYKSDYLQLPHIHSLKEICISIILLIGGFIVAAISWQRVLLKSGFTINACDGIAGVGISIFGKYIPGKVWQILGPSAYISARYNYPMANISVATLEAELVGLWVGLCLGALGLIVVNAVNIWGWGLLLLWLGLTILIFTRFVHTVVDRILRKLLKRRVVVPKLSIASVFSVMPWFVAYWSLWGVAFYFFVAAMTEASVSANVALCFPLAGSLGILAVIVPGGLGVREGIIAVFLTLSGLTVQESTSISVFSRLWFLFGECCLFLIGLVISRYGRQMMHRNNEEQKHGSSA